MDALYTAEATSQGGRQGRVRTPDGAIDLFLAIPVALGGAEVTDQPVMTNPEQLFAAGFGACFDSTLRAVANREQLYLGEYVVTARISIGYTPDGMFGHKAEIRAYLPELERAEAERLLNRAYQYCPYSKATRGNMEVILTLV